MLCATPVRQNYRSHGRSACHVLKRWRNEADSLTGSNFFVLGIILYCTTVLPGYCGADRPWWLSMARRRCQQRFSRSSLATPIMPEISSPACSSWFGLCAPPVRLHLFLRSFSCLFWDGPRQLCLSLCLRVSAFPRAQDRQRLALRHDPCALFQVPWYVCSPQKKLTGHTVSSWKKTNIAVIGFWIGTSGPRGEGPTSRILIMNGCVRAPQLRFYGCVCTCSLFICF